MKYLDQNKRKVKWVKVEMFFWKNIFCFPLWFNQSNIQKKNILQVHFNHNNNNIQTINNQKDELVRVNMDNVVIIKRTEKNRFLRVDCCIFCNNNRNGHHHHLKKNDEVYKLWSLKLSNCKKNYHFSPLKKTLNVYGTKIEQEIVFNDITVPDTPKPYRHTHTQAGHYGIYN